MGKQKESIREIKFVQQCLEIHQPRLAPRGYFHLSDDLLATIIYPEH